MMRSWLGLDIGTSALKALSVAEDGTVLARASVPYEGRPVEPGPVREQDPRIWVDAAETAIRCCVGRAGMPAGIGLTGQVPTVVLVDEAGAVARPAMTWQDVRAVEEAKELAAALGPSEPYIGMDLPWSPAHLPAKLRWLAVHEPDLARREIVLLQPKDYLGMLLTGSAVSDAWSLKGIASVKTGLPARDVIAACGWDVGICPSAAEPWAHRGSTVAEAFGLTEGIPVSTGWSDALCSILGVGAFGEPRAFILTGTSEIVGLSTAAPTKSAPGLYRVPTDCAPRNVLYGPTQSSGGTARWLARLLGVAVEDLPVLASSARSTATPAFVPYVAGERAPIWRSDVRAVFAGIDETDGAAEIARSVLSGISLSAADILGVASASASETFDAVHIAGSGVADAAWGSIRLQTLGVRIHFHPEPFVAALGAAMLGCAAATGVGCLAAELDVMRGTATVLEPDECGLDTSRAALADYRKLSRFAQTWRTT